MSPAAKTLLKLAKLGQSHHPCMGLLGMRVSHRTLAAALVMAYLKPVLANLLLRLRDAKQLAARHLPKAARSEGRYTRQLVLKNVTNLLVILVTDDTLLKTRVLQGSKGGDTNKTKGSIVLC